jgi:hypothetical protein
LAALGSNWDQISLVFSRVFVEIPYSTEQGIILEEQGIFFDITRNLQGGAGKFTGGRRGRENPLFSAQMEF